MGTSNVNIHVNAESVCGIVGHEANCDSDSVTINMAVRHAFDTTEFILATFSEYTIALFHDERREVYSLYDSHSCNENGVTAADGFAILLEFETLNSLITYLTNRHMNSMFEMSSILISYAHCRNPVSNTSQSWGYTATDAQADSIAKHHFTCGSEHLPYSDATQQHVNNLQNVNTCAATIHSHRSCAPVNVLHCSYLHAYSTTSTCTADIQSASIDHDYCRLQPDKSTLQNNTGLHSAESTSVNWTSHAQFIGIDHAYCTLPTRKRVKRNDNSLEHSYSLSNGMLEVSEGTDCLQFGMPFEPLRELYDTLCPQVAVRTVLEEHSYN